MKIFVYEYICGGGLLASEEPVPESLRREGGAMLAALCEDFQAIEGVEVYTTRDQNCSLELPLPRHQIRVVHDPAEEKLARYELAAMADWTVVIAPEFDSILLRLAEEVHEAGGRLLGPGWETIELLSDKDATCRHLARAGLPVPEGLVIAPGDSLPQDFLYPAVLKPIDGAGSIDTSLVLDADAAAVIAPSDKRRRLERYVPGRPCSVVVLNGTKERMVLTPCWQHLAENGTFAYEDGAIMGDEDAAYQATVLALAAAETLPDPFGYIGVDMVLSDLAAVDGMGDAIIELNPRLTTSYVGLRHAFKENLAEVLLAFVTGGESSLTPTNEPMQFNAEGEVTAGTRDSDGRGDHGDWLAVDIGGANLKIADGQGYAKNVPFALWQKPHELAAALSDLLRSAPSTKRLAITMTGELADCFETKTAGVHSILDAVEEAAGSRTEIFVYLTDGRLVWLSTAREDPLAAAASNWHALAAYAATFVESDLGLLVDIGSTTTDIIPLVLGRPAAEGATDTERLLAGELVYTGVARSPVCAVVQAVPYRGVDCPLAQEWFATMRDVYLMLGDVEEDVHDNETADGRAATIACTIDRLARMVCSDRDTFDRNDAMALAQAAASAQQAMIVKSLQKVVDEMTQPPLEVVISGQGEFLARRCVREVLGDSVGVFSLSEKLGPAASGCAPAHALALLANKDRAIQAAGVQ